MKKALEYYLPHIKIILYIVVFIVCFGLALLLFTAGSGKTLRLPTANGEGVQTIPTSTSGSMILSTVRTSYLVGQDIELTVNADSSGTPITGYDLLFLYDPVSISVVGVTSVDPTFDVFTFNKPNYVSVTGTKKLSVSSEVAFVNAPILSITVRAKKAGMTPLVIAPQLGPERTKLVDNTAQIMYPQLGQTVQLNIQ